MYCLTKRLCCIWLDATLAVACGVFILSISQAVAGAGINCSSLSDCGWMAQCTGAVCHCDGALDLHDNGKDCKNSTCSNPECLQCTSQDSCTKCAGFIAKSTGLCLQKCEGSAEMQGDSLVCTESKEDKDDDEIIIYAVVGGVAAGTVLCIIVIIIVCIYIRRTRRNINLQSKSYNGRHMDAGNVKKFSVYDNNAFEHDISGLDYRLGKKMDPLEYQTELERLRPHMDTLMTLLSQTRSKTRAMKEGDPRLPTYKGMIHQLCRVLVLLHKKDPVRNLPSDALSLVQWGHQMVEDSRQQEVSSSEGAADFPMAQISSVDLDMDYPHPISPVYATPDGSTDQGFPLPAPGQATPYSSVPVPFSLTQQDVSDSVNNQATIRKSGFASISRTPSIPNGVILRNLELSQPREETITHVSSDAMQQQTPPVVYHQPPVDTNEVVKLRREEFRNFLITSKDSPTAQQRISSVDDLEGETVITGGGDGDETEQASQTPQKKTAGSEEDKFNTFGRKNKLLRSYTEYADTPVHSDHKTRSLPRRPVSTPNFGPGVEQYFHTGSTDSPVPENPNTAHNKQPVSQTYSVPHKQHPRQTSKKNIITNPNAIQGSSSFASVLGLGGKKSKQATPAPTTGYFANGHFYDPNPMPVEAVDGEVYAPGSNYSDHSNVMSTFLGDLPRSRSPSSSNRSEDGEDSENSGGDLDVFPFDPNDATDPVEV